MARVTTAFLSLAFCLTFGTLVPVSLQNMIFSSTNHLRRLNVLEQQLGSILGQYVRQTEEALDQVKSYLRELSETDFKMNGQNEQSLSGQPNGAFSAPHPDDDSALNPIKAFHVIRRLAIDFKPIYEIFKAHVEIPSVLGLVEGQAHLLPLEQDLHSAALTLVRLQDTYNLNVSQLARGNVLGISKNTKFSARDCLYLGKHSFNNGFYGHALSWFDEALKLADLPGRPGRPGSATVDEVMTFRKTALQVHDETLKRKLADKDSDLNDPPRFRLKEIGSNKFDHSKFNRLCQGEKLLSSREESSLRCYYSHRNEAFLLLQPVKVEERHSNPSVLQFHDLISEDEARAVRDLAAPKLIRAMVQGLGEVKRLESAERVSRTAWLHPDHSSVVSRLNRRVQMVSGLSTDVNSDHSEVTQVANYGIGGFYQPHFDYLIVDKPESEKAQMDPIELSVGDRTATLMFYLSEVIRGGATVFPRLGIGLFPKKLSAVFWYNLKRNGEGDKLTLHGGCPVVYGEKWVANYWFREIGQTFRRRCSKNKNQ